MLSNFLSFFNLKCNMKYSTNLYDDFISQLGGKQFGDGLFNSFSRKNLHKWTNIVNKAFPDFNGLFKLFGYDWLGRCFGIDLRNSTYGKILMFEIGTNDVLEIPCSLESFLNEEIPIYSDSCLAYTFFCEWLKYSNTSIEYGRCIGYKVPLFLGGEDNITNLENNDMEIYWDVLTQILDKI